MPKGGSGKEPAAGLDKLFGKEYTGVTGQAAVNLLLREKQGHVKEAFYREDIEPIDVFWGDDTAGLDHILKERLERGINGTKFVENLADVVENGEYLKEKIRTDSMSPIKGK